MTDSARQGTRRIDLETAARTLAGLEPLDLLSKAYREIFPGRIAVVSSFGAESAVLLDLVARVDPGFPVIFLDTERHFPETLAYRDELIAHLGLTGVRTYRAAANEAAAEDSDGALWARDPDACCDLRKVRPLDRALSGFDAWVSGRKRFHGDARSTLETVEIEETPQGGRRLKLNPLADWPAEVIDGYHEMYDLPRHPLRDAGYPSIGCAPCTARPDADAASPRAGRWAGRAKTECGIHARPATAVR